MLAAPLAAGSRGAELACGAAAAAFTGLAAYFGARIGSHAAAGDEGFAERRLAARFAAALGLLTAAAFALSTLAGWTARALRSLVPPG